MYQLPVGGTNEAERTILRKLRVWIAALMVACLVVGAVAGALLSGRVTVAQTDAQKTSQQVARAPEALSASFAEIARRVEPAVVNIDTLTAPQQVAGKDGGDGDDDADNKDNKDGKDGGKGNSGGGSDNPLMEMFRKHMERPSRGVGSGFIVDPKGYILTNQHVIEGATRINVKLQSGEVLRGTVVGQDDETDVAVVKVSTSRDLPSLRLGNSDDTQVGDWVLAIGSPFGLDQTVTAGIISTLERQTDPGANFRRFLQTDAAINRGNSGGPLVNMRGEVIGINSQIATVTGDYNGIGFALPANEAGFVYQQLVSGGGKVQRGYLGVILETVRGEYARVYGLPDTKGAIVTDVREGPAVKAGIEAGDIIVGFNNQLVASSQDLINKVASTPVGQTIELAYLRDMGGKLERRTVGVAVGERPARIVDASERETPATTPTPGKKSGAALNERPTLSLTLSELTAQLANERNLKGVRGLLVRDIDQSGLAYEGGVRQDMVIQRVNRIPVNSLAEFERIVSGLKVGDAVVMNVVFYQANRINQAIVQFTYQ